MGQLIDGKPHLAVPEAAERLGMNEETLRRWIRGKKLPAEKVGHQYFIREVAVEAARGVKKRRGL